MSTLCLNLGLETDLENGYLEVLSGKICYIFLPYNLIFTFPLTSLCLSWSVLIVTGWYSSLSFTDREWVLPRLARPTLLSGVQDNTCHIKGQTFSFVSSAVVAAPVDTPGREGLELIHTGGQSYHPGQYGVCICKYSLLILFFMSCSYLGVLSYLAVQSLCPPVCLSVLAKCLDLSISLDTVQSLQ